MASPGGIVLSAAAESDIHAILAGTHERFGAAARRRNEQRLVQAILDVAAAPERVGCVQHPDLHAAARTCHVAFSRDNVAPSADRVKRPRHFLVFRCSPAGVECGIFAA